MENLTQKLLDSHTWELQEIENGYRNFVCKVCGLSDDLIQRNKLFCRKNIWYFYYRAVRFWKYITRSDFWFWWGVAIGGLLGHLGMWVYFRFLR